MRQLRQQEQELAGGMWGVAELKKVLAEGERNGSLELSKISDVIWE